MELKLDNGGSAVLQDGKPVYTYEDGKEIAVDVPGLFTKIAELNNENKKQRLKLRESREKLQLLEEIEESGDIESWVSQARRAMKIVENLEDKDLDKAGELEEAKAALAKSFEAKLQETRDAFERKVRKLEEALSAKEEFVRTLLVKGAFEASTFIRERTVLTPDIAYEAFGKAFDVEEVNGEPKVVARRPDGEKILSRIHPGEYADPEEAIEIIVNEYSRKDHILRGVPGGSGAGPSSTGVTAAVATAEAFYQRNPST